MSVILSQLENQGQLQDFIRPKLMKVIQLKHITMSNFKVKSNKKSTFYGQWVKFAGKKISKKEVKYLYAVFIRQATKLTMHFLQKTELCDLYTPTLTFSDTPFKYKSYYGMGYILKLKKF